MINPDKHLSPINKIPDACLDLPGSKSIANRVLLLSAIADGESIIHNVPDVSEDVSLMLQALSVLGVKIIKLVPNKLALNQNSSSYKIVGCKGQFPNKSASIFCGNSGTTIRFLTAVIAVMSGEYILTGIERMYERPIYDLVDSLRQIGAAVDYLHNDGFPPLSISKFRDNLVSAITISGQSSSQYLTGLLIALPLLERDIIIKVSNKLISKPYIDITLALLEQYGCRVESQTDDNIQYHIFAPSSGSDGYSGVEYVIEPDASSASYFLAMGAISGSVRINNLSKNSLQGDKNFAQVLAQMGAKVVYADDYIQVGRRDGIGRPLSAININMQDMPDVAMTVAVLALFAEGVSTISGIASWRVKETDRILAMHNELTKLGARVNVTDDSITIVPPQQIIANVAIDTYNDHRMAMCFSLIAVYGVPVIIKNYQCVSKTFANYFELFEKICY
ncbi:MAG: 3-phosphoshikimate 1-carboxyvinyltransferase [Pseudomonadota bacterium]|nr:3-phosphoshikimate 1-carboxyvinyltransferase [Pseudomonadota bacterium]